MTKNMVINPVAHRTTPDEVIIEESEREDDTQMSSPKIIEETIYPENVDSEKNYSNKRPISPSNSEL